MAVKDRSTGSAAPSRIWNGVQAENLVVGCMARHMYMYALCMCCGNPLPRGTGVWDCLGAPNEEDIGM